MNDETTGSPSGKCPDLSPKLIFNKQYRLLQASEFDRVFANPDLRLSNDFILVIGIKSGLPFSRMGLVVGKKKIARAVDRNRFKRLARESFRRNRHLLDSYDLVFLARRNIKLLGQAEQQQLFQKTLEHLIEKQQKKERRLD